MYKIIDYYQIILYICCVNLKFYKNEKSIVRIHADIFIGM